MGVWRAWKTVVLLAWAAVLSACSASGAAPGGATVGDRPIRATATTGMIADLVRRVGGDRVEVTALMRPGVDPHLYKASQGDLRRLERADVVFYNGLYLEGKMEKILESLGRRKAVVAVTRDIGPDRLLRVQGIGDKAQYDPHVWFDVRLWMIALDTVREELARLDPAHADAYRRNAEAYRAELEALDQYARLRIASVPKERRVLVTAHDAFQYFGRAYDIEVRGLQGVSTAAETGTKDVTDLRDMLVRRGIKAVFVETSVPEDRIRAVIEGAAELGHRVVLGGSLYSDSTGPEGTPEGTYVGMFRHNVDAIVDALK